MGQANPSVLKQRLLDVYAQLDLRARMANLNSECVRVDVHLNRTIWLVVPALQRDQDPEEVRIKELLHTGVTNS